MSFSLIWCVLVFACKGFYFMYGFSLTLTSYVLASLALFRMAGVFYPHKYKQICSDRNAKIIILSIIAFSFVGHLYVIFLFELSKTGGIGYTCRFIEIPWKFIRVGLSLWSTIVTYFVPMLIIVFANASVIWKLWKKRSNSIGMTRVNRGDHAFSHAVTVLVAISLMYLVTMSPMWVFVILKGTRVWPNVPGVDLALYRLGWTVANCFSILNSTLNFGLYCLTHPQFLNEMKLCFRDFALWFRSRCPKCKKANAVGVNVIHVKGEFELCVAGPSGLQARLETAGSSSTPAGFPGFNTKVIESITYEEDSV